MDSINAPQFLEHINHSLTYTPFEFKWVPCSPRFIIAGQTPKARGILQIYRMREGKLELSQEVSTIKLIITNNSGFKETDINAQILVPHP